MKVSGVGASGSGCEVDLFGVRGITMFVWNIFLTSSSASRQFFNSFAVSAKVGCPLPQGIEFDQLEVVCPLPKSF